MAGKARDTDRLFEAIQNKFNNSSSGLQNASSNNLHGQFFVTPPPLQNTKKFLERCGGVMDGSIGDNISIATIASGVLDISRNSGKYSRYVIVKAETGTIDTLSNIIEKASIFFSDFEVFPETRITS